MYLNNPNHTIQTILALPINVEDGVARGLWLTTLSHGFAALTKYVLYDAVFYIPYIFQLICLWVSEFISSDVFVYYLVFSDFIHN